jgi:hypothetical protein
MMELTNTKPVRRPNIVLYTLGIFAVAALALFLYTRYHKSQVAANPDLRVVPGIVRAGNPDFEYYKNYVRIQNVKAELGVNFAQSRIAIISGIIANEGDRKLEAVELHIALYDVYDKLSKERDATPLRPGVGINRPMDPLEKRGFTVWIEPIEHFWNPKRLEIELTGLKYQ